MHVFCLICRMLMWHSSRRLHELGGVRGESVSPLRRAGWSLFDGQPGLRKSDPPDDPSFSRFRTHRGREVYAFGWY